MNIILIGFMGTGKSAVGKLIASRIGYTFQDTDALIEAKEQRSIPQIFAENGETYFRDLEQQVAKEIALRNKLVVATGGGFVLNPDNLAELRANSIVLGLTAQPEVIYSRVKADRNRPLLAADNSLQQITDLLAERTKYYAQADLVFDTSDGDPEFQALKMIKAIQERVISNGKD